MYPYRVRIDDPLEIDILKKVSKWRSTDKVPKKVAISVGMKIPRTIKDDGFHITRGIITISNPRLKLDYKPAYANKKGLDFIFKKIW